ncbi:MAG: hypothetical protein WD602_02925 [Actinomycetota bacterium]
MDYKDEKTVSIHELENEAASELPPRSLLATVSVLGFPVAGVSDVGVNADTSGPGWLISG